jgi:hypothetical protein
VQKCVDFISLASFDGNNLVKIEQVNFFFVGARFFTAENLKRRAVDEMERCLLRYCLLAKRLR